MLEYYNPNPSGRHVGDCAVRALSKALDWPWEKAYLKLAQAGYLMADMPSSNSVFGAVLRENGYKREVIPNECPDCYTLAEFARDHPSGTYVVGMNNHVATVIDGTIYDAWNSEAEIPIYMWRKDD